MSVQSKAICWAVVIIGAAVAAQMNGLSDSASMGITAGLTGAAWGTLSSGRSACGRGCH